MAMTDYVGIYYCLVLVMVSLSFCLANKQDRQANFFFFSKYIQYARRGSHAVRHATDTQGKEG
jgi:hypothetical protein